MALDLVTLIRRAVQSLKSSDYVAASASARKVLIADPSNEDALHVIGLSASGARESTARIFLARLAYLVPSSPIHWLNLGIVQQKAGDRSDMARFRALILAPSDQSAIFQHVRVLVSYDSAAGELHRWIYRLVTAQPISPEILGALSAILRRSSRFAEALLVIERAVAFQPAHPSLLLSFASLRTRVNQPLNKFFERLHRLSPDDPDSSFAHAEALSKCATDSPLVELQLQRALVCRPDHLPGIHNLGLRFHQLRQSPQSVRWLQRAVGLNPNVSACVADFAWAVHLSDDTTEGISILLAAITRFPLEPRLRQVLASIALENRRIADAQRLYSQCVALEPSASAHYNRVALVFLAIRETDGADAVLPLQRALIIDPSSVEALTNRGILLERQGLFEAACAAHVEALAHGGSLPEPKLNLAICELGLGRFESGWRNYEARWDANSIVLFGRRNLSKKLITSKPRFRRGVGGRVLLWSEQGVGDEIMFASMISDFRKQCDDLLVEVDTRLLPIFERSFPQIQCVPRFSKIPESLYDYQLPIGSLGEIVRPSLSSFEKSQASYLSPDLNLVDDFKRKLGESTRAVVGLSWWSKNPDSGAGRSVPLTPLLGALPPNLTLVNLQYGDEQSVFKRQVIDEGRHAFFETGIDNENELDRLAAMISACDLVISIGNATAHLSAALGKPTWVLVPIAGSWRWMFRGVSTPWYPSVRIFRRGCNSDWGSVLTDIVKEADIFFASK